MTAVAAVLIATDVIDGEPMALLPWRHDEALIEYEIDQLLAAGVDAVEVVLGADAGRVVPLVRGDGVDVVISPRPGDPAASLRAGASSVPRDTHAAIIMSVREPRSSGVLRLLLDAHISARASATVPVFEGTPGRPVVLGQEALARARNVSGGDDPLSKLLTPEVNYVETTGAVLLRVDTHNDADAARRLLAS